MKTVQTIDQLMKANWDYLYCLKLQIEKRQDFLIGINDHIRLLKAHNIGSWDASIIEHFNKKIVRYQRQLTELQRLSEKAIREYNSNKLRK